MAETKDGWRALEPTDAMIHAGRCAISSVAPEDDYEQARACWFAMLDARPSTYSEPALKMLDDLLGACQGYDDSPESPLAIARYEEAKAQAVAMLAARAAREAGDAG